MLANLPSHEIVLAPLILIPNRDVHLLAAVLEQVEVELLGPTGAEGLVDGF